MIDQLIKTAPAPRQNRNGSSLLVVLALLAITLTVSYAMVRSQVSSVQVQANQNRAADAQQAAMTGIAVGLRRMHDSDWGGIEETPSGQLDDNVFYSVQYKTGDPSLESGDPDFALYPYRVTVISTGTATDPGDANVVSSHRIQVVVQLVPRKLSPALADWSEGSPYTFYQWKTTSNSLAQIELPVRIEGKVRFQSELKFCNDQPADTSAKQRLLDDLLAWYEQTGVDQRPFNGQIDLPFDLTDNDTRQLLESDLGLTLNDKSADDNFEPAHPGSYDQYQLYPGGEVYDIETFYFWLTDEAFQPDPKANPLGLFQRSGRTFIQDNVSIQGTLIVGRFWNADLNINGSNVNWSSYTLPVTLEDGIPIELPAAYVAGDLTVGAYAQAALTGVFAADDDFEVASGDQEAVSCQLDGHLLCNDLKIRSRDQWEQTESWWQLKLVEFLAQLTIPLTSVDHFPQWLEQKYGLDPQPKITIRPRTETVNVHWMDFGQPLFVPHEDDDGLMWEVVDWDELD